MLKVCKDISPHCKAPLTDEYYAAQWEAQGSKRPGRRQLLHACVFCHDPLHANVTTDQPLLTAEHPPEKGTHVVIDNPLLTLQAAAERGWLNEKDAAMEALLCFRRAGADLILTYYSLQASKWMVSDMQNAMHMRNCCVCSMSQLCRGERCSSALQKHCNRKIHVLPAALCFCRPGRSKVEECSTGFN
jgi:hypothetical protein